MLILTYLINGCISVKTSLINPKLWDVVNLGVLFLTVWINSCLSHNLDLCLVVCGLKSGNYGTDPKWVQSIFEVSLYELDQINKMQIESQGKITMDVKCLLLKSVFGHVVDHVIIQGSQSCLRMTLLFSFQFSLLIFFRYIISLCWKTNNLPSLVFSMKGNSRYYYTLYSLSAF